MLLYFKDLRAILTCLKLSKAVWVTLRGHSIETWDDGELFHAPFPCFD